MARMPVIMSRRLFWNKPLVTVAIAPVWGCGLLEPMEELMAGARLRFGVNCHNAKESVHSSAHKGTRGTRLFRCRSPSAKPLSKYRSRGRMSRLRALETHAVRARRCLADRKEKPRKRPRALARKHPTPSSLKSQNKKWLPGKVRRREKNKSDSRPPLLGPQPHAVVSACLAQARPFVWSDCLCHGHRWRRRQRIPRAARSRGRAWLVRGRGWGGGADRVRRRGRGVRLRDAGTSYRDSCGSFSVTRPPDDRVEWTHA